MAGFPLNWFVGEVNENLHCPVCFEVLNNPVQCPAGHLFCSHCLAQSMERNGSCPSCRGDIHPSFIASNTYVKRDVESLITRCYVKEEEGVSHNGRVACDWTGPLASREEHRRGCQLQITTCSDIEASDVHPEDRCEWTGPLGEKAAHILNCQFRRSVTCPYTQCFGCTRVYGSRSDLRKHLVAVSEFMNRELTKLKAENVRLKEAALPVGYVFEKSGREYRDITYFGQVKPDGQTVREGLGILLSRDGNERYLGSFKDGLRHGRGSYFDSRSFEYDGMWALDQMSGYCHLFYNHDLHRYGSGTFVDGVLQGKGKIWSKVNKFEYVGDFVKNKRHGKGTQTNASGMYTYKGEFADDIICGEGVCTYADTQHSISGTFRGHLCCGKGVLRDQNGVTLFAGDFVHGVKSGNGVMSYANGDHYSGAWRQDKKHGKGVLRYADGSHYSGGFLNDQLHGEGTITDPNGVLVAMGMYYRGVLRERDVIDLSLQ